jgi:prepilin-type N-terminal cleavage/methylation domain-containing protein
MIKSLPGGRAHEARPRAAFTLIEVLVVVAIIALLVAILLPSLNSARELSRRGACATHQHQIMLGLAMYTQDFKGALPHCWDVPPGTDPAYANTLDRNYTSRYFWFGSSAADINAPNLYVNLGHMWPKYIRDGQLLYCPSSKDPFYVYSTYAPFPNKGDKGGNISYPVRVGYNYNPWVKLSVDQATYPELYRFLLKYSERKETERLYQRVDDKRANGKIMLTDMFSQIYDNALFVHKAGSGSFGWNVSLGDGSVRFRTNSTIYNNTDADYPRFLENLRLLNKGL